MIRDIGKEINQLRAEVDRHRLLYHSSDTPEISDESYDALLHELINLEKDNPQYDDRDSPSKLVGGEILDGFQKVKHAFSQWSYDNIFSFEGLETWQKRNLNYLKKENLNLFIQIENKEKKTEYFCELKIDGLKIIIEYRNGEFYRALTRGDGEVGEDVTHNVKTFKNLPKNLKGLEKIESLFVTGEVWIGKSEFERINLQREKEGLELYKNPRNLSAGTLRQLDSSIVAERNLQFFAYAIESLDFANLKINTQQEIIQKLKDFSFLVNDESKLCENLEEVQEFYENWNGESRYREDYSTDGLVIKTNNIEISNALGYTAKSPRGGVAYKFMAEESVAELLSVTYQVGRSGVVTPVAELSPVQLAGTTVRRATLHNFDEIERLGVRVGDKVSVRKAGDIIPQIFDVFINLRTGSEKKIQQIKNCPVCDSLLEKIDVKIICKNEHCEAKRINKIIYFASRKCMNIEGLGESTVEQFYQEGFLYNISDIYKLENHKNKILEMEGWRDKSVNNLLESIGKTKNVKLEIFLASLGIDSLGQESAIDLAKNFKTFENFWNCSKQDLLGIFGFGERGVDKIMDYKESIENQKELQEILKFVKVEDFENSANSGKLENMRFVITGTFDISRSEIESMIKSAGGKVQADISKTTNYLIVGEDAGNKLAKAKKLSIKTLSLKDFLTMI